MVMATGSFKKLMAGFAYLVLFSGLATNTSLANEHQHHSDASVQAAPCSGNSIVCAKTVTSAFAPNGDLWRLWVSNDAMYYQISRDNGKSFASEQRVSIPAEKISARNENRPKIAFDGRQGVYLSWATPKEKKYTADVRFSYSKDYGQSFSLPVTVNNDGLLTGHSFNEMQVSAEGDVSIVWLDGRLAYQQRKQGKKPNGSELYLGQANPSKGETGFSNLALAQGTCVCCRIATDIDAEGELAILWRHIFGDNIREFALMTLDKGKLGETIQVSYDHWKINGCPHQGGAISIDSENRYHMVWFNLGTKGKGIFYASSKDQGQSLTSPLAVGDINAQAAHPHLMENNGSVDIVWTQFTGTKHQLWHQRSNDNGQTFMPAIMLAEAISGSDRPFIIKKAGVNYVSWQRPKQGHLLRAL